MKVYRHFSDQSKASNSGLKIEEMIETLKLLKKLIICLY